jgi:hypothetical protein
MNKILIILTTSSFVFLILTQIENLSNEIINITTNFGDYQQYLFMLMPFLMIYSAIKGKNESKDDGKEKLTIHQKEFEREMQKAIKQAEKEKRKNK